MTDYQTKNLAAQNVGQIIADKIQVFNEDLAKYGLIELFYKGLAEKESGAIKQQYAKFEHQAHMNQRKRKKDLDDFKSTINHEKTCNCNL